MSILAAVDTRVSMVAVLLAVSAAAISLAVAWLLGILRNAKLTTTRRIPPDRPLAPLVGALFAGLVVWLVLGPWLLGSQSASDAATLPTTLFTSDRKFVLVNALVPAAAFVVLLTADALVRPQVRQQLGFGAARFPLGTVIGVAGMVIAVPVVYASMVSAEWVYQKVGFEHPSAHDLLKTMGQTPDAFVKNLAIVVAVIVAPFWEELLFRGHVQTLLRETIVRIRESARHAEPRFPVVRVGETLEDSAEALPAVERVVEAARPKDSWLAILLTSFIFASIHAPWTFPPIFVLSACLGFAYERTGNLWVPIAMHAAFNGLMTIYFLISG